MKELLKRADLLRSLISCIITGIMALKKSIRYLEYMSVLHELCACTYILHDLCPSYVHALCVHPTCIVCLSQAVYILRTCVVYILNTIQCTSYYTTVWERHVVYHVLAASSGSE